MIKKIFLRFEPLFFIFIAASFLGATPQRPNIILILVDDMGFSDIGSYGGEIETPHLDKLARDGLRFTQFYNNGKCAPSRASIMTGLYAHQVGMAGKGSGDKKLKHAVTLGEVLRNAGYRTWMTGKWHGEDNPFDRGFDHYYGLKAGAMNHFNPGRQRPGENIPAQKGKRVWVEDDKVYAPAEFTPDPGFYSTDAFTGKAMEYLETYRNDPRPFFLHLTYTAPHFPLHAWEEDIEKYRGRYSEGWEEIRKQRYERQKVNGIVGDERHVPLSEPDIFGPSVNHGVNPEIKEWNQLTESEKTEWDLLMATYAAMVDRIDQQIGLLLEKLKAMNEYDNTLILFCSDNGAAATYLDLSSMPGARIGTMESYRTVDKPWANASNTPLQKFKHWSHEGGIRTPLIAHWPDGLESDPDANGGYGRIIRELGHIMDFMPTFMELAGAEYPKTWNGETVYPYEGESLLPVFRHGKRKGHGALFFEYEGGAAVRQGDWKLVRRLPVPQSGPIGPWELYFIPGDETEMRDVSALFPKRREQMIRLFQQWASRPDIQLSR